jgi:hypothetical protein
MAIRIFSDRIEIGNFTLSERLGGISGIPIIAAEKRKDVLSFNGLLSVASIFTTDAQATLGAFAGGAINPLSSSWAGIDRFPFSTISSAKSVGQLYQSRSLASGASSRTNGYVFGGIAGSVSPVVTPSSGGTNTIDRYPFNNDLTAKLVGSLSNARSLSSSQSSSSHAYITGGVPNIFPTAGYNNFVEKYSFTFDGNSQVTCNLTSPGYGRTGFSSDAAGFFSTINSSLPTMRQDYSPAHTALPGFVPTQNVLVPTALAAKNGKFLFASDNEVFNLANYTGGVPTVMTGVSAPDAGYFASITIGNLPGTLAQYTSTGGSITTLQDDALFTLKICKFPFATESTIQGIGHLYGAHPSTIFGRFVPPSFVYDNRTDFQFIACSSGDSKAVLGGGSQQEDGTNFFGPDFTPNIYYKMNRLDSFPYTNMAYCTYVGDLATGRSGMVGHSDK